MLLSPGTALMVRLWRSMWTRKLTSVPNAVLVGATQKRSARPTERAGLACAKPWSAGRCAPTSAFTSQ